MNIKKPKTNSTKQACKTCNRIQAYPYAFKDAGKICIRCSWSEDSRKEYDENVSWLTHLLKDFNPFEKQEILQMFKENK